VQSIPRAGEKPQTFETVEPIEARVEWNALRPRRSIPQRIPALGTDENGVLYFEGIATGLKPGDGMLIVPDSDDVSFFARVAKATLEPAAHARGSMCMSAHLLSAATRQVSPPSSGARSTRPG
jgi:hypothetical protein